MKKIAIMLAAGLMLAGCDKFLDIKPKDKFIPQTFEQFERMLDNRALLNFSDMHIDLATDDAYLTPGAQGMPGPLNQYGSFRDPYGGMARNIYRFIPKALSEADNDQAWSEGHNRLFYINTVINNILTVSEGTEAERRSVWAEALVMRALEHFALVNLYAMHYDPATAASEPGIPMAVEADLSAKFPRSTVKQTYDHIINDLTQALPYLPDSPSPSMFRASLPAGYAMLAKVYFTMGEYETALEWVEKVLAVKNTLVNYNDHHNTAGWMGPNVPASPVMWNDLPAGKASPETIMNRTFLQPFGMGQGVVSASPELTALYEHDYDLRWYFWYADSWPFFGPTMTWTALYGVRVFLRGDFFNNALTVPDMLLIRAECNARAGQTDLALDDVNELRRNRFRPEGFTELTTDDFADDEAVLRFVLEERRRELAFTGNRLIDLKRLNLEPRFAKTITHTAEGQTYVLEPNSRYYMRELWPAASKFNPQWPLNFPE